MMNIVCVICSDNLQPSDDIFNTPCGHIFHYPCLTQWLERSRTCPQCREKATHSKIHRVYFNFSNNDTIVEDASTLQAQVDSLKFQVLVKDREVNQSSAKNESLKKQTSGLRAEVRKLESALVERETAMYAFKEQLKFFKELSSETEKAKSEVARLKKKLDDLRNVQVLLNAPGPDVDEMIESTKDTSTLVTYISVMKRELTAAVAKRKQWQATAKKAQQDLTKVSMERNFLSEEHAKRKQLENDLVEAESRMMEKDNRIRELEKMIPPDQRTKNFEVRKIAKPAKKSVFLDWEVNEEENTSSLPNGTGLALSDVIDLCGDSPCERRKRPTKESQEDVIAFSPEAVRGSDDYSNYLQCHSQGSTGDTLKRKATIPTGASGYSILAKKPRIARLGASAERSTFLTYDGFGGHSKNDKFPSPKKFNLEPKKYSRAPPRKPKLDDGNNKKLGNFVTNDL